jgi:hypothetical protein
MAECAKAGEAMRKGGPPEYAGGLAEALRARADRAGGKRGAA